MSSGYVFTAREQLDVAVDFWGLFEAVAITRTNYSLEIDRRFKL